MTYQTIETRFEPAVNALSESELFVRGFDYTFPDVPPLDLFSIQKYLSILLKSNILGAHDERIETIFERKAERGYEQVVYGQGPLYHRNVEDRKFIWAFEFSSKEPRRITTIEGEVIDPCTLGGLFPKGICEKDYGYEEFQQYIKQNNLIRFTDPELLESVLNLLKGGSLKKSIFDLIREGAA